MFIFGKFLLNTAQKSHVFRFYGKKAVANRIKPENGALQYLGQPTHETHPHLLSKNEVTPLIQREEFEMRRIQLMERISKFVKENNSRIKRHLVVVPSASKQYMSDKIPYVFRQNSDFLYLTGCQEPDSCLVMLIDDLSNKKCTILFMREKDDHSELWDGPRTGPENSPNLFGVDRGLLMGELENYIQSQVTTDGNNLSIWYDYMTPIHQKTHKIMFDVLNNNLREKMWESPKLLIHKQRLIKSGAEIALLQKSCDVASQAIAETIKFSQPGLNEHQLFAKVDYECRMNGAEFLAYPPVVASGNRANIIHYINNNQIIQNGDLILMDAGCEFHGYTSDITRTWPVNGEFTTNQKELYEAVLDAQVKLINLCQTFPTLDELFDSMCIILGQNLQKIGLIPKYVTNQALMKATYQFCPHHVSHYLGMDVHDTPSIPRTIKLKPGMVITVEPGVYISHKHKNVPRDFQGFGVRIEDDVLITEDGPVVLSRNCPKNVSDIEIIARQTIK